MPLIDQTALSNHLLRRLRPGDFTILAPHLEPVDLHKDDVLSEPDQPFQHATFFERGIGSVVALSPDGQMVESGLFGPDGFWPVGLALGVGRAPYRTVVQVAGEGHRVPLDVLDDMIAISRPLHDLLLRFAHTLSVQTAYTALSNAVHPVEVRLARWLLMCHDRVMGNELALTHEFLSIMLAVRRPSVTVSLHVLEGRGFVRAKQGLITITDRKGLEAFAGGAYGRPEAEYGRLIGPLG